MFDSARMIVEPGRNRKFPNCGSLLVLARFRTLQATLTLAASETDEGPIWAELARIWPNPIRIWPQVGPKLTEIGPKLVKVSMTLANIEPNSVQFGQIWPGQT